MNKFEPRPFGKYFLTELIAVGGMAEIYKAKTFGVDGFEKTLAIKKILHHFSTDKEFITMLSDEAKLVVNLSHANIVQVYDLGRVGDDYFISMEYIDGINLRELIDRAKELNKNIPPDIAIYIISEICKGLDYAHSKKDHEGKPLEIVHRDVSPQNILVSYDAGVKIVDFGIAKAAMNSSQTNAGILKGKVTYMAPEQAFGKPIDGRTDLFSCGIMLYELLTLERLFTGESQMEILKKIRNTKITVDFLKDKIPNSIRPLLSKSLAYSVKDRHQTASDLQIELTRILYSQYPDFSPRKLSDLMYDWFSEKYKARKREQKEKDKIKETVIVSSKSDMVNLVHKQENSQFNDMAETIKHEDNISPREFTSSVIEVVDENKTKGEVEQTEKSEISKKSRMTLEDMLIKKKRSRTIKTLLILFFVIFFFVIFSYIGLKHDSFDIKSMFENLFKEDQSQIAINDTEKKTDVIIHSDPSGAIIFLNEKNTSLSTPATLKDLEVGKTYKLKLVKNDHPDIITNIQVTTTMSKPLEFLFEEAQKNTYSLTINSNPSGAMVFINGKENHITPYSLQDLVRGKSYEIKLQIEKYETLIKTFVNNSTDDQILDLTLQPIPTGAVSITSEPSGALVWVNGKETLETTPFEMADIDLPQKLQIELRKEGYQNLTKSFDIKDPKKQNFKLKLEKIPTKTVPQENKTKQQTKQTQTTEKTTTSTKDAYSGITHPYSNVAVYGKLRIDSTPRGASVKVNGVGSGITPIVLSQLPKNKAINIQVEKKGYKTWSKSIQLTRDRTELNANLISE